MTSRSACESQWLYGTALTVYIQARFSCISAQDLLNQWVNEKIYLDNNDDDDGYTEEAWTKKTEADIKKEWDHLLTDEVDLEMDELVGGAKRRSSRESSALSKGTSITKLNAGAHS